MSNQRRNQQIRLSPVRLIDHEGKQCGIVPTSEALKMAMDVGLDLVEVSPNERPPVCKIMDYGKTKYQKSKIKQKHHERKLKEVRIRPKTDPHDKQIKMKQARKFLEHGDRVQFTMIFRGRERVHRDMGVEAFDEIARDLNDIAKVDRPAKILGRRMTMVLAPIKPVIHSKPQKPAKKSKSQRDDDDGQLDADVDDADLDQPAETLPDMDTMPREPQESSAGSAPGTSD